MEHFEILSFQATRSWGGDSAASRLVRFVIFVRASNETSFPIAVRLPFMIHPMGKSEGKKVEAVGLRQDRFFDLIVDVSLFPGEYEVTVGEEVEKRRFSFLSDSPWPVNYCVHDSRTPSRSQVRYWYDQRNEPLFSETRSVMGVCCQERIRAWNAKVSPAVKNAYVLEWTRSLKGPLRMKAKNKTWTVHPGEYLVVNPEDDYDLDGDQRWPLSVQTLRASQSLLRSVREALGLPKVLGAFGFEPGPRRLTGGLKEVLGLFDDVPMGEEALGAEEDARRVCELFLIRLLNEHPNRLSKSWERSGGGSADHRLRAAVEYMARHFSRPLTMNAVARETGVGEDWMRMAFRRVFHQSPNDYLQGLRVRQAMVLLKDSDKTVEQVALAVGYRSSRSLQKAFTQHADAAPQQFRASLSVK